MRLNIIPASQLTTKQREAWAETRTALLYQAPMFSHIMYSMMTGPDGDQAVWTRDVETAATDDARIIVNPEGFLPRPLGDRVFIAAHEICHAMFRHAGLTTDLARAGKVRYPDGKELPFNVNLFEYAKDIFINKMLVESDIGTLPPDGAEALKGTEKYTTKMSTLDIYRGLYEDQEKQKKDKKDQPEPPPPPQGFDKHLPPGSGTQEEPQQAMDARDEERWQAEIQAAVEAADAQGKLSQNLKTALGVLQTAQTNYRELIRSMLDRAVGTGGYDWRLPDRRMITRDDPVFAPGRRGFKCRLLVLIGDSSGSVNDATVTAFMNQVSGVLEEMEPERILFTWCDTRTHGWQEITCYADIERVHKAGAKGRGGTDFRPVFTELDAMGEEPEALIYLTDGYGRFPKVPPAYQVIWGSTTQGKVKYPFGEVVHVPVQAE
ncbi:vWA domain-containing protein [Methylobacterium fujisawaense]